MVPDAKPVPEKKDEVASVAGQVPRLPTGERAALRRMYLTESTLADGVVVGLLHRAGTDPAAWHGLRQFRRWRLLVHIAAVLSGTAAEAAHDPRSRLGRALHAAGYSENRLMRLTAAKGPALEDQVRRAAQFLAKAGKGPVNLWSIHNLLDPREDVAEKARFEIARDYYDAEHGAKGGTA